MKKIIVSIVLVAAGFLAYSYNAIPMKSKQLELADAQVTMPEPVMSAQQKTTFYRFEMLGHVESNELFLMTMVAEDPFEKATIEDLDELEAQMNIYAKQMGGALAAGLGKAHSDKKRIMVQGRPGIYFENSIADVTVKTQCIIDHGKAIMQMAIYKSGLKYRFAVDKFISSVEFPS
jgi:hypothetical protein